MTETKQSNGRPWTLTVGATTGFNEGMGSNDQPYLNFRADIETSRGVKNRFVSVFNTLRFPTLIDDVKQALASGATKLTLRFEYDKGETAKVLGVGYVDFRKSAGSTPPTDGAPAEVQAALPLETPAEDAPPVETRAVEEPVAEEQAAEPRVEEPMAQVDPMQGVIVEMKKPRRRRKAA